MADVLDRRNAPAAQPLKRNWVDDQPCPEWGTGSDGRSVKIGDDPRFPALFREWLADACEHLTRGIVQRDDSLGRPQYFEFCTECGLKLSSAIAHAKVGKLYDVPAVELDQLNENYNRDRKADLDRIANAAAERCQPGNRESYDDYLRSEAWLRRRAKIMQRANGLCEGCLTNPAEEVHHLTYEHVGAEFAWELRAICSSCHRRLHKPA